VVQSARRVVRERLPEKWHAITKEMAKFGTIGLINLVVNFAVFNLLWLTVLRNGELKAKAIAAAVAITSAYFMNRHWTYRDRPKSTLHREYALFFFVNIVGLIIEVLVVGVAKYGFGQTHIVVLNICTGFGILLGTIFRFWAYRTHVFKEELAPRRSVAGRRKGAGRVRPAARTGSARTASARSGAARTGSARTGAARNGGKARAASAQPRTPGQVRGKGGAAKGTAAKGTGAAARGSGGTGAAASNGHSPAPSGATGKPAQRKPAQRTAAGKPAQTARRG
jgi:putative flippase GtrA